MTVNPAEALADLPDGPVPLVTVARRLGLDRQMQHRLVADGFVQVIPGKRGAAGGARFVERSEAERLVSVVLLAGALGLAVVTLARALDRGQINPADLAGLIGTAGRGAASASVRIPV